MRRGLMRWDESELPEPVLRERQRRMQAALREAGLDAILIYTNLVRPAAVSYFTAFTPYWSDAVLMLPSVGEPLFATALSKRVANWIRSVNPTGEIANTPQPGKVAGERLATAGAKRVGVLELDSFPAGLFEEVEAAAPGLELVDATSVFATVRGQADAAELALIERAAAIAKDALAAIDAAAAATVGDAVGPVERRARLAGAEECYVAIAPDLRRDLRLARLTGAQPLGDRFAVRASVAYKGAWSRRTSTFGRTAPARDGISEADNWLRSVATGIDLGQPLGDQIRAGLAGCSSAELLSWMAEAPLGSYPLQVVARPGLDLPPRASGAAYLVLSVSLRIDGHPWLGAVPVLPTATAEAANREAAA